MMMRMNGKATIFGWALVGVAIIFNFYMLAHLMSFENGLKV
jgi:hypothetical protein